MSYTVSQIVSMFHDFDNTSPLLVHNNNNNNMRKKGKALFLATTNKNNTFTQKELGMKEEDKMLDLYEEKTGRSISGRNEKIYNMTINGINIVGRIDGIVDSESILIEHKRRVHGLLHRVPYHELVQCYLYMKMINLKKAHLVETFGNCMEIHEIIFDEKIWENIKMRCFM